MKILDYIIKPDVKVPEKQYCVAGHGMQETVTLRDFRDGHVMGWNCKVCAVETEYGELGIEIKDTPKEGN